MKQQCTYTPQRYGDAMNYKNIILSALLMTFSYSYSEFTSEKNIKIIERMIEAAKIDYQLVIKVLTEDIQKSEAEYDLLNTAIQNAEDNGILNMNIETMSRNVEACMISIWRIKRMMRIVEKEIAKNELH
jgi:hypothetical protein